MPYIITTSEKPPLWSPIIKSRRTVATLEEAQQWVAEYIDEFAYDEALKAAPVPDYEVVRAALSESGGTIGPFPDGTVIEVIQT